MDAVWQTPGLERGLTRSRPLLEKPLVLKNGVDLYRQRAAYGEQISHLIRINFIHTTGATEIWSKMTEVCNIRRQLLRKAELMSTLPTELSF